MADSLVAVVFVVAVVVWSFSLLVRQVLVEEPPHLHGSRGSSHYEDLKHL